MALTFAAIPARAQAQQGKRVWTTEDVSALAAQGLLSIVGQEAEAAPAAVLPAAATTAQQWPVYNSRTEDPAWYADQAAKLRAELDASAAALAHAQDNLVQGRNLTGATGSVKLDADVLGVTPDDVIANLEEQVRGTQGQIDELADLARRNDIVPGVVRAAAG
jgi:hypothetical protein